MGNKIVLIQFSSRNIGNSAEILKYICLYYHRNTENYIVSDILSEPCGNCNYECLQQGKLCPKLTKEYTEMMHQICNAELVYFIVPNYCGYPCANYFVFNERSVGYFNMDRELLQKYLCVPKRFIVISNSEGQSFTDTMWQQVNGEPNILYLKSSKYCKRSIAGDILDSEEAKADLNGFLESAYL